MEAYQNIASSDTVKDSRNVINNNILTAISQSAATSFPTTHVLAGRTCYRTDELMLYICNDADPQSWMPMFDLGSGKSPNAQKLDGYDYTAFLRKGDTADQNLESDRITLGGSAVDGMRRSTEGVHIEQHSSSSKRLYINSIGNVDLQADSNENGSGGVIRFHVGANQLAYIDSSYFTFAGKSGYVKARFGAAGSDDTFVEFRDNTSDTWRHFGFDASAQDWYAEIPGNRWKLWHQGNDANLVKKDQKNVIVVPDSVANQTIYANSIEMYPTGSDTLTADHSHIGNRVYIASDASGGDAVNEHRLYGSYTYVVANGDSDIVYGTYSYGRSNVPAGESCSDVRGGYNVGVGAGEGTVSNIYGCVNYGISSNIGPVGSLYGSHNRAQVTSVATGSVTSAYGVYSEVEVDAASVNNIYGVRSVIDIDGGATDNAYLFHGEYQGSLSPDSYGIYIDSNVENHLGGNLLVENGIQVNGSDWNRNFRIRGPAPCIYFDQDDDSNDKAMLGLNGEELYLLADKNADGVFDSTSPFPMQVNINTGVALFKGSVGQASDERLKEDIQRILNPVEKIRQLGGYTYTRIDTGERQTGVLAQEVKQVLPEAVRQFADDGMMTVAYGEMIGLVLEGVRALDERITALEEINVTQGQ